MNLSRATYWFATCENVAAKHRKLLRPKDNGNYLELSMTDA
jgi:hypothetical protein